MKQWMVYRRYEGISIHCSIHNTKGEALKALVALRQYEKQCWGIPMQDFYVAEAE
jgi:hypothetical protein